MKKLFVFIFVILLFVALLILPAYAGTDQVMTDQKQSTITPTKTTVTHTVSANRVSMTAAAAVVRAAPAAGHYRYSLIIRNLDTTNTVYLGAASVTASTGFPLKAGETITLDRNDAAIYGICDTGLTAIVAYFEEGS